MSSWYDASSLAAFITSIAALIASLAAYRNSKKNGKDKHADQGPGLCL